MTEESKHGNLNGRETVCRWDLREELSDFCLYQQLAEVGFHSTDGLTSGGWILRHWIQMSSFCVAHCAQPNAFCNFFLCHRTQITHETWGLGKVTALNKDKWQSEEHYQVGCNYPRHTPSILILHFEFTMTSKCPKTLCKHNFSEEINEIYWDTLRHVSAPDLHAQVI